MVLDLPEGDYNILKQIKNGMRKYLNHSSLHWEEGHRAGTI